MKRFTVLLLALVFCLAPILQADVHDRPAAHDQRTHQFDAGFLDGPTSPWYFQLDWSEFVSTNGEGQWYCVDRSREWTDALDYVQSGPYDDAPTCQ